MELGEQHCRACGPGTPALVEVEVQALLDRLPLWHRDGGAIHRDFTFASYQAGLVFVNAVAGLAEQERHHPDLELGYKKVRVRFSTHAAHGLTMNDFIAAARVDLLAAGEGGR